jgi:hypothetical protein
MSLVRDYLPKRHILSTLEAMHKIKKLSNPEIKKISSSFKNGIILFKITTVVMANYYFNERLTQILICLPMFWSTPSMLKVLSH